MATHAKLELAKARKGIAMMSSDEWIDRLTHSTRSYQIHWKQNNGGWMADCGDYHISVRRQGTGGWVDYTFIVIDTRGVLCHASGESVRSLWHILQQFGPRSGGIGGWFRRMLRRGG